MAFLHAGPQLLPRGSHYHTAAALRSRPTDPGAAAGISPSDFTDGSHRHTESALLPFSRGGQGYGAARHPSVRGSQHYP